jgi:hypothetical protein
MTKDGILLTIRVWFQVDYCFLIALRWTCVLFNIKWWLRTADLFHSTNMIHMKNYISRRLNIIQIFHVFLVNIQEYFPEVLWIAWMCYIARRQRGEQYNTSMQFRVPRENVLVYRPHSRWIFVILYFNSKTISNVNKFLTRLYFLMGVASETRIEKITGNRHRAISLTCGNFKREKIPHEVIFPGGRGKWSWNRKNSEKILNF